MFFYIYVDYLHLSKPGAIDEHIAMILTDPVSAIAIQAQAGRAVAATDPASAVETLAVIEAEASRTLCEMRAMVRVLRGGDLAGLPQPVEVAVYRI